MNEQSRLVATVLWLFAALMLSGCNAAVSDPTGGESHWLVACSEDAVCESGRCRCGACATGCSSDADCSQGEVCLSANSSRFEATCHESALCVPACQRETCGPDAQCSAGACVLRGGFRSESATVASEPREIPLPPPTTTVGTPSVTPGSDDTSRDCSNPGDGSRIGFSPNPTDSYLPDCESGLTRDYYRVFQKEDGTAYMVPRPSALPALFWPCQQDLEDPLRMALERYDLCQTESIASAQGDPVDSMDPDDALAIANYLHEQLVFVPADEGTSPFAEASDILDLCKTDQTFRAGVMSERCDFELEAETSPVRTTQPWTFTPEQSEVTADALNALYGIDGEGLCRRLSNASSLYLRIAVDQEQGPCTTDEDCIEISGSTDCFPSCGATIAVSGEARVNAERDAIEAVQCASFERAACPPEGPPPCGGFPPPTCVEGVCGYPQ